MTANLAIGDTGFQRIAHRTPLAIEIVEPRSSWPADFAHIESLIRTALGANALSISHVGSTSVPGLPAKPVIDVDLAVPDPTAEDAYVPALEAAGFRLLSREPKWDEHRFFGLAEPYANLHVFKPDSSVLIRDRMFRDWLREHGEDRDRYAAVKKEAARVSRERNETVNQYSKRKTGVIQDILERAFRAAGMHEQPRGSP
jgi:GrpB-like predicted nucleotidyltransferase (UPF0157 family)